jgi:hypothetical protein
VLSSSVCLKCWQENLLYPPREIFAIDWELIVTRCPPETIGKPWRNTDVKDAPPEWCEFKLEHAVHEVYKA